MRRRWWMRHWRRALAVAAGAFASFAAYRAAPAAAPTSAALAADERVRSAMASSCSDTCRALRTGPRCIARCKKAKRSTAAQAALRETLGLPDGEGDGERGDPAARRANATRACAAGRDLEIGRWTGRLGNALLQVANCLSFAVEHGCACAAPGDLEDKFLNASRTGGRLRAAPGRPRADARRRRRRPFRDSFWNLATPSMDARASPTRDAVLTVLRRAYAGPTAATARGYDVHVHVRGGDVFGVHDQTHYAPPPVSYYADALDGGGFGRIRVVSEDRNPVVDELLRRYPAADWAPSALADDVAQLVNARRVVYGVGTFAPALLMFNAGLEAYVRVNYAAEDPRVASASAVDATVVDLVPYFRDAFPWRATRKQVDALALWPPCGAAAATCEAPPPAATAARCERRRGGACWRRVKDRPSAPGV